MTDQASLLELARKRDPEALAQIYDTYAAKIYAYIYRYVGDPHRAEDLTSSVFLKALEALERDKFARDALQSWLYRIAHNIVVDDIRKRERRPISTLHDGLALPPETNPDFVVSQQLEGEELLQAIDQLSETQRSVIILRFGEGLTAPQVANILDKTEEAVRALQRRGLANLRRYYAETASKSTDRK